MGQFRYISDDEVAQRQRARTPKTPPRQTAPSSVHRNVQTVLDLGDVRYFSFSGRSYRIAPVPFKAGQRVLDSHIRTMAHAKQVVMTGDKAPTDAYYKEVTKLTGLLWKYIRPAGRIRRILWRCGLLRNPFRNASERDVKDITDFFLRGRMMSSVQLTRAPETP